MQPQSDRIYSRNGKRFKLKKDVLNRLFYYNKSPTSKNNQHIDKTFVDLLLLSAFDVSNLKRYKLDEDILDLIEGSSFNSPVLRKSYQNSLLFQGSTKTEWDGTKHAVQILKNLSMINALNYAEMLSFCISKNV